MTQGNWPDGERAQQGLISQLLVKAYSHLNLFINGCREVELGKGLPLF